ncbi:hypothetical protein PR048_009336 [Dryococelus australis]|uniref:Uncharacterized protein n=1 Tax=Dryococelus australis TaxID=614101 RepID=A0ABQ9HZL2_9NEOP|nr:hypothetical protein PR048_009336 [Dryococelus australis]
MAPINLSNMGSTMKQTRIQKGRRAPSRIALLQNYALWYELPLFLFRLARRRYRYRTPTVQRQAATAQPVLTAHIPSTTSASDTTLYRTSTGCMPTKPGGIIIAGVIREATLKTRIIS